MCLASFAPQFAHAQTVTEELKRIDKLRSALGDDVVSALTNLPPSQYFAARDRALELAAQVKENPVARSQARAQLCAALEKSGAACSGLTFEESSEEALSAVSKPEADRAEQEQSLQAEPITEPVSDNIPQPDFEQKDSNSIP